MVLEVGYEDYWIIRIFRWSWFCWLNLKEDEFVWMSEISEVSMLSMLSMLFFVIGEISFL